MADELVQGSHEWWVARLWAKLDERAERIQLYEDYYQGDHRLRFTSQKAREAFGGQFKGFSDNFCLLVVDAIEERLRLRGFRVGGEQDVDDQCQRIWTANDMDVGASMAHTEALVNEEAYAIVWVGEDRETPVITVESPFEVIVDRDTGRRRHRRAALKRWVDEDDEHWRVVLYLPDQIVKMRSVEARTSGPAEVGRLGFWTRWVVEGEEWPLPNPLGIVPVVPLTNMPRLGPHQRGTSELKAAVPLQDAINKTVWDEMIASEFLAYPQRWMVGVAMPTDADGTPIPPFKAGSDRVWFMDVAEGATVPPQMGQFPAADLSTYVERRLSLVGDLAAITKTPKHYLIDPGGGTNLSGETVKALEAPLVSKARRKHGILGVGWQEVMALALRLKEGGAWVPGDEDRIEVVWWDPETRTESQHVDALVKLGSDPIGIPQEQLWRDAGYSEEQIKRFREMKAAEPPPPPPVVASPIVPAPVDAPPQPAPSGDAA